MQVDPNKLRAYGVPLLMCSKRCSAVTKSLVPGIEMAEAEYMVTSTGYIQSVADIEAIPLGQAIQGTPLTIAYVASVNIGPQMRRGIAELNGEGEVVGGVVVMRFGENAQNH